MTEVTILISALSTLFGVASGVLAWIAKLRWSQEYATAKDEIIRAKEAQIAGLRDQFQETLRAKDTQIQIFKDLTPQALRDYYTSNIQQLEEVNKKLQYSLDETKKDTASPKPLPTGNMTEADSRNLVERAPASKAMDPRALDLEEQLPITDKNFDAGARPQKINVVFTNQGKNPIHINRINYSDTIHFPATNLMSEYQKESRYYIIPFAPDKAELLSGGNLPIELRLRGEWQPAEVNRHSGQWGYFHIDVTYNGEPLTLFYSI